MPPHAISARNLAKEYRLGQGTPALHTLRDALAGVLERRGRPRKTRSIWALHDVTFDVGVGEAVGIIGPNGAGKSTLLKILSRITEPTRGEALVRGRVGSLLEVGTGFHPELTGRENIFLNGAILGMRRRDIVRRFDEIVGFAEIEQFIDTPVKRYSTGMGVRLAFAVAAHLEPEVLMVDEVLAVGDASFQAKCLGKMGQVTREGRTVLLVSHNMATIASLAERCLWLDHGGVRLDGPSSDVIRHYVETTVADTGGQVDLSGGRSIPAKHHQQLRFTGARLLGPDGRARGRFFESEPITLEVEFEARRPAQVLEIRAYVRSADGAWLFSILSGARAAEIGPGRWRTFAALEPNHLRPGAYLVGLELTTALLQDRADDAIGFEIEPSLEGYEDPFLRRQTGFVRVEYEWSDAAPVEEPSQVTARRS